MSGWYMYWVSVEYTLEGWSMGVVGWYGSGGPWRLLKVIEGGVYVETLWRLLVNWETRVGMWVVRLRTWQPGSPLKRRMGYLPWLTSCLLLWLKFQSASGASHHSGFMGSYWTISHTFYSLIYPVDEGNVAWIQSIVWGQCKSLEFDILPINNNLLNGQNHSSSDSHHLLKKFPQQNSLSHCTEGKGFSPYPLKLFGKLCPPSFQPLNQSFISNQRTISM